MSADFYFLVFIPGLAIVGVAAIFLLIPVRKRKARRANRAGLVGDD